MRVLAWTFVAVLVPCATVHAQTPKVPVYVTVTIEDDERVAKQLVFELKEAIRGSQMFELIDENPFARRPKTFDGDSLAFLRVSLAMMTEAKNVLVYYALSTAYDSLDVALSGVHVSNNIGRVGSARTQPAARSILATLADDVETLKKQAPGFYKNLIGK
jgi:hypothetical protein